MNSTTPVNKNQLSIFICIDWFEPAFKAGGPIRSVANLLQHFSKNSNYSFKVFCSCKDADGSLLDGIEPGKWVPYSDNASVWYNSKNSIAVLKHQLQLASPDVVLVNGIYSWYYNLAPLFFAAGARKIVAVRGMLHPGALSQKAFKKKLYLFFWKLSGLHRKLIFQVSSGAEETYTRNVFGDKCTIVIANNFPVIIHTKPPEKVPNHLQLLTVALISPMKNYLAVLQALQQVNYPVQYNIYGAVKDEAYWQLCQQQIASLPGHIVVNWYGPVNPNRVGELMQQHHVFIMPSKSENYGHAIAEALSAGLPVITSHNTPWNLLQENSAGLNVPGDDVNAVAAAINRFAAMGHDEYLQWSAAASKYAGTKINIEDTMQQYTRLFNTNSTCR
ncbi:MAG TPA: glycosyltransferase family 4 protein [Ferruginibacter sp.]|nr:glycosyltransferase family 4 protein [Ferruginibacter sp.]HMP21250.1 glycosyltransferase family 4 protein [Ferruginibacter sp.]